MRDRSPSPDLRQASYSLVLGRILTETTKETYGDFPQEMCKRRMHLHSLRRLEVLQRAL